MMLYPIDLLFLASCIYLPPLILLYMAEIWTILKPGSPFKSSFYYLFVAGAIADLIMIASVFYEFRLVFFPLVNGYFADYECGVCTQIRVALSYICPFTQDCLNCFVAFNRFTSIRRPVHHFTIWKVLLPVAIISSALLATAIFGVLCFRKIFYIKVDLGWTMYFALEDPSFLSWFNSHRITSIEMIITNVIIIVLYAISARSLRKFTSDSSKTKQEIKLLLFGMINFVIMLPLFFLQVMLDFKFFPSDWELIVLHQFAWLIDVKCFCAAVTMITVNTTFRKHMMRSFKRLDIRSTTDHSVSGSRQATESRRHTVTVQTVHVR